MKIFLSYPSAERPLAERLVLALEAEGHEVFFDRDDLPAGETFHARLREGIQDADAMIFFVTPASVKTGAYALTEMEIARQRWAKPGGRVLPVMVAPTPINTLPAYLSAVTLLLPKGELVAETVAAVAKMDRNRSGTGRKLAIAGAVALVLAGAGTYGWRQAQQSRAVQTVQDALQRDEAAATQARQMCEDGSHGAALQQLGELAAHVPASPHAASLRDDCAMRWIRQMRALRGENGVITFDQQLTVVQPVLVQALAAAQGQRAADLRAHLGWAEYLRQRESTGVSDPVPHWRRAIREDVDNVYAHAMWGNVLTRSDFNAARKHFERAVASGRERAWVRGMQMANTLGGDEEQSAYAVAVANEMRRGNETLTEAQRRRLWTYAFGQRLLDPDVRKALFAALPAADLLTTFEWLYPAAETQSASNLLGRFGQASLQFHAGQHDAARGGFESLVRDMQAARQSGRVLDQSKAALAALARPPA